MQCIALLSLFAASLLAACASVPPSRPIREISADQLKKLLDEHAALMLVDTRTEYEYRKGHIPGAVQISPDKFDVIATLLPQDKDLHLVFYCRGSG